MVDQHTHTTNADASEYLVLAAVTALVAACTLALPWLEGDLEASLGNAAPVVAQVSGGGHGGELGSSAVPAPSTPSPR
ncbi:MAG: hypothetical protein H6733_09505 [Alphaproteobacteria bacterium]|nr:hypothetical protein [Alphaproteobacteria bacterium]